MATVSITRPIINDSKVMKTPTNSRTKNEKQGRKNGYFKISVSMRFVKRLSCRCSVKNKALHSPIFSR